MKSLELDIDLLKSPEEVFAALQGKTLDLSKQRDFTIYYSHKFDDLLVINILLYVTGAVLKNADNWGNQSVSDLWNGYVSIFNETFESHLSINQLLLELKSDLGISWKLVQKKGSKKQNPLDEMFGLWQGRSDISLEKIRYDAWPERN